MRTDIEARLKSYLPAGAMVLDIKPYRGDPERLLIEYSYQGDIYYASPARRSYKDYVYFNNHYFYRQEGLTYNDLYEIFSTRFNLDFIKGEDYVDNPKTIGTSNFIDLPISPYSLRYLPETIVMIAETVRPDFNYSEEDTDMTDTQINPYLKKGLKQDLFRLAGTLFDGTDITCFINDFITIDFRNRILDTLQGESDAVKNEVLSAILVSQYNDGVSDVMVLKGDSNIPFILRYKES